MSTNGKHRNRGRGRLLAATAATATALLLGAQVRVASADDIVNAIKTFSFSLNILLDSNGNPKLDGQGGFLLGPPQPSIFLSLIVSSKQGVGFNIQGRSIDTTTPTTTIRQTLLYLNGTRVATCSGGDCNMLLTRAQLKADNKIQITSINSAFVQRKFSVDLERPLP